MTEFDFALEYLQMYVQSGASPAQAGDPLHDRRGFFTFCEEQGASNRRRSDSS